MSVKSNWGKLLVNIIFLFGVFALQAQSFVPAHKELYHITYGKQKGLPDGNIYDMAMDSKGYLYLAMSNSLFRFDGYVFKDLGENQTKNLSGASLMINEKDAIYMENFDGYVFKYQNGEWSNFQQSKPIHFLKYGWYEDTLMVIQRNGIDIFHTVTKEKINHIPALMMAPHNSILYRKKYFVINDEYLLQFNTKQLTQKKRLPVYENKNEVHYLFSNQKYLFVAKKSQPDKGIWQYDENLELISKIEVPEISGVLQYIDFIEDQIWVSTTNGLFLYQQIGNQWKFQNHFFEGESVSKVLKGLNGAYWISIFGKGLILVPDIHQYIYKIPNETVSSFFTTGKYFFAASRSGKIFELDSALTSYRKIYQHTQKSVINYLYVSKDKQDIFYVPNYGCHFLKNNTSHFLNFALKHLVEVDTHLYIMATSSHLLMFANGKIHGNSPWYHLFETRPKVDHWAELLSGARFKMIQYDSVRHEIYVLANSGIYRIDTAGKATELLDSEMNISAQKIILRKGMLYYTTYEGSLYRWKNGQSEKIPLHFKVQDISIYGDELVLKSTNGFHLWNPEDHQIQNLHLKINHSDISYFVWTNQQLVFLNDQGWSLLKRTANDHLVSKPSFQIERVLSENQAIDYQDYFVIPHKSNNIDIFYSIINYTYADDLQLKFQVNKGEWETLDPNTNFIQFHHLSAGKYQIKFKVNDEIYPEILTFKVKRPFWQQWWFYVILFFLLSAFFILLYQFRKFKYEKEVAFLEEKIQLEKQLAQSMLTSIKAQMNPHFYFNALNSIQAFIYKNDTQNAIDYLGKFSKLTRNILNQTSQEKISLDEEMKMLEWYLDLEKMRFNHSFNFEIKAAPDIDVRNTNIPPMLIQPYAENAVKHGFNGKNRNGWIQIHFSQEEDVLCVEIEDNGIGRAEAAKYSNAETSFSTHANQKRLEILNAQIGRDITVKYIDKTNPEGKSIGTLVILYIPIL